MVDGKSGCAITYNGEIYNFPELRKELSSLGEDFHSESDTEVILRRTTLGHRRRQAVPRHLALALWDRTIERRLSGRDQMGIKPLYCDDGQERRHWRVGRLVRFRGARLAGEWRGPPSS